MADTPLEIPELVKRGKIVDYRKPIWGDSFNWSWNRTPYEVKYVVIHHTVTSHDATPDDIALLHKARGWGGIGYHFVITKDGTVYYVGDVGTARANVLNKNEQVIGIAMVGDFTKHLPTDAQIISAHQLSDYLIFQAKVFPNLEKAGWDALKGHKDLQATACPGTSWPNDMRDRIINEIPYSPKPEPEPTPDPKPQPPDKDYETLYNQLKTDFETYKREVEPKVDLYKWAALELNTNMEGFKSAIGEILDNDGNAKRLFTASTNLLQENDLLYPDNVDKVVKLLGEATIAKKEEPDEPDPPADRTDPEEREVTSFWEWLRRVLNK